MDVQTFLASLGAISIAVQLITLCIPHIRTLCNVHIRKRLDDYLVSLIRTSLLLQDDRLLSAIAEHGLKNQFELVRLRTLIVKASDSNMDDIQSRLDVLLKSLKSEAPSAIRQELLESLKSLNVIKQELLESHKSLNVIKQELLSLKSEALSAIKQELEEPVQALRKLTSSARPSTIAAQNGSTVASWGEHTFANWKPT